MSARNARPPLDESSLSELALRYVGRFATSRAKLRSYLARKLRERGWGGRGEPDPARVAERFAKQGYVDDAAYALGKSRALTSRGYGKSRVALALRGAGIDERDGEPALAHAQEEAVGAALRFARKRRLGPYSVHPLRDPREREKALAAMVRAGHPFALSRAILKLEPGAEIDSDALAEQVRY